MENKEKNELEEKIKSIMDKFTLNSSADDDQKNFELLESLQRELMLEAVNTDLRTEELSPFLKNFLREFDNIYEEGIPESIVAALKRGERMNLTEEWIRNYNKKTSI